MSAGTINSESLAELFDQLRKKKIARCNVEDKKGVTPEEKANLERKIKIYEYLIDLVIKEI